MRYAGKTVVVTGGASGIGLATAQRFFSEGANVVIADINGEQVEEVGKAFGAERCRVRRVDVSDFEQVNALMQFAEQSFGGLDVLFNNAAIGVLGTAPELSLEDWHRVINVDLSSVFYGCKAVVPIMRKRGGGAIINTASISGMAGEPGAVVYGAAKAGVINFTRAAAVDHGREGIRINAICPGPINTPALARRTALMPNRQSQWNDFVPLGRVGLPEEIASVVAFLASSDAAFVNGAIIPVDGGVTAQFARPKRPPANEAVAST